MRKVTRFSVPLPTFVSFLRFIPLIDRFYQRYYPAHHEYEKHTGKVDYGRVGLSLSTHIHPHETESVLQDLKNTVEEFGFLTSAIEGGVLAIFHVLDILQPIADMLKDFIDTFKPYKSDFYSRRDWYQPLNGLKNIITAVLDLLIRIPILAFLVLNALLDLAIFSVGLVLCAVASSFYPPARPAFLKWLALIFMKPIALIAMTLLILGDASLKLIQGFAQVITTPLTWTLRKILRNSLTSL